MRSEAEQGGGPNTTDRASCNRDRDEDLQIRFVVRKSPDYTHPHLGEILVIQPACSGYSRTTGFSARIFAS